MVRRGRTTSGQVCVSIIFLSPSLTIYVIKRLKSFGGQGLDQELIRINKRGVLLIFYYYICYF